MRAAATLPIKAEPVNREQSRLPLWPVLGLVAAGMGVRLLMATVTIGTNDVHTFNQFGHEIAMHGLAEAYRRIELLNHPPLVAIWSWLSVKLDMAGGPLPLLLKLPAILGDLLAIALLWSIMSRRFGRWWGGVAAVVYAWHPAAILVAGYHGNTDNLHMALALLSVWLVQDRGRHFWGGVALGAAINIKLIPVLLIAPMLLSYRNPRHARLFLAGLALCALPFVPLLIAAPDAVWRNMLSYGSSVDRWGVNFFLLAAAWAWGEPAWVDRLIGVWRVLGRLLVLGVPVAVVLWARRRGEVERYALALVAACAFLVFAPGFGVQYLVFPAAFALIVAWRLALAYALAAGATLLLAYAYFVHTWWPAVSFFQWNIPWSSAIAGLLAWGLLIAAMLQATRQVSQTPVAAFGAHKDAPAARAPRGRGGLVASGAVIGQTDGQR